MTDNDITDQATTALHEYGFALVHLDQPGAPTPARIADHLANITTALDKAIAVGDLEAIAYGIDELKRLRLALDEWDGRMTQQNAREPLSAAEFLAELRAIVPSPASVDDREDDGQGRASASKKLFRREAWYEEAWWYDEIVVATDEEEWESADVAYQGDGRIEDYKFNGANEVEEISPDDLDEAEARAVAEYLADAAERDAIKVMTLEQVRDWIKRKLLNDRRQGEGQYRGQEK